MLNTRHESIILFYLLIISFDKNLCINSPIVRFQKGGYIRIFILHARIDVMGHS